MSNYFNNINDLMTHIQNEIEDEINGFISFDKLFDNGFLDKHSKFPTFEKLLKNNNIKINTQEEFDDFDESILDIAVNDSTEFSTWKELYEAAGNEFMVGKLREAGFDITN